MLVAGLLPVLRRWADLVRSYPLPRVTVLDAVREYRGPGTKLCPSPYDMCRTMNPLSGTLVAPETAGTRTYRKDTRLVTESVVRDPLLLVRLQKRLDTWTHPWTCIALVLYMVMAAVKS